MVLTGGVGAVPASLSRDGVPLTGRDRFQANEPRQKLIAISDMAGSLATLIGVSPFGSQCVAVECGLLTARGSACENKGWWCFVTASDAGVGTVEV